VPGPVTPQAFEAQIRKGDLDPVYLLLGPDDDRKSSLVARLTQTIEDDFRPFNVDKIFPADLRDEARKQFWHILQLARTLPMMVPRRVVVVAQAEKLMPIFRQADDAAADAAPAAAKKGRKAADRRAGDAELDALEEYLANPSPECVLVFVAGDGLKRNLKPVQLLEKQAVVVDCDPLADAADAIAWAKAEAEREGVRIEAGAARLLAKLAGGDITRLRAEFERALLFASGDGIITEAVVQEIASAPTTQNPWAMTNAIERGQAGEALRELALKFDAGEIPVMILGQLAYCARAKLTPGRVEKAVGAVFRTDLALKTSRGEPRVLLERLVVELCGEGRAPDGAL